MSLIANYCKEISRELDYNVVPQTPLRELQLVAEMRWLRTMLREAKLRLDGVEDLELDLFDLKDKNDLLRGKVERFEKENAVLRYENEEQQQIYKNLVVELYELKEETRPGK